MYDLSFPFIYCEANVFVIIELNIRGTKLRNVRLFPFVDVAIRDFWLDSWIVDEHINLLTDKRTIYTVLHLHAFFTEAFP